MATEDRIDPKELLGKLKELLGEDIVAVFAQDEVSLSVLFTGGRTFRLKLQEIK